MTDFTSWSEVWNHFLCTRLAAHPWLALELAKYQTRMAMLFTQYLTEQCLRYDRLFHQAAAHDPTLNWDELKEDIYVWCLPVTPLRTGLQIVAPLPPCSPFVTASTGQTSPVASAHHPLLPLSLKPHSQPLAVRSARNTISADVEGKTSARMPMYAGHQAAMAPIQAGAAPSGAERELVHHPDKAWVSKLLHGIRTVRHRHRLHGTPPTQ